MLNLYYCGVDPICGLFYYSFRCGSYMVGEIETRKDLDEYVVCRMSRYSFLSELNPIELFKKIQWS